MGNQTSTSLFAEEDKNNQNCQRQVNNPQQHIPIYFYKWKSSGDHGYLANESPHSFEYQKCKFANINTYLGWAKAITYEDYFMANLILKGKYDLKYLENELEIHNYNLWNDKFYDILLDGLWHKFSQNPEIEKRLAETGNRLLVYTDFENDLLGIGKVIDLESAKDPRNWKGGNLLGKALMEIREKLCDNLTDALIPTSEQDTVRNMNSPNVITPSGNEMDH